MSQLAIYVLIFILLGLYVPLIQINSAQQKNMHHRRLRPDKRRFAAKQWDLVLEMSLGQKWLIGGSMLGAIVAVIIYFSWDTISSYF